MKRRLMLVIDIDTEKHPDAELPFTPEKVEQFLDETPEGVEVVLIKLDGIPLHRAL